MLGWGVRGGNANGTGETDIGRRKAESECSESRESMSYWPRIVASNDTTWDKKALVVGWAIVYLAALFG